MAGKAFNTGKFAEKVMALSTYDSMILQNLYINPVNKQKITRGAAFFLKNYFNEYVDSRARQSPNSYHHIYEFDQTGKSTGRLFKAIVGNTGEGSSTLTYTFTPAKMPNRDGYPFPNKATVMEEGETIVVTPKRARYLKYELDDGRFVTSEKSVINNPGGPEVRGSFESTFRTFMAGQAQAVLEKQGYYRRIEQAMITKRRLVIPRINAGSVAVAADRAKIDAMNIASGVLSKYA
jgi:hypothetical protein